MEFSKCDSSTTKKRKKKKESVNCIKFRADGTEQNILLFCTDADGFYSLYIWNLSLRSIALEILTLIEYRTF